MGPVIHKLAIWVKRRNMVPTGIRRFIQKHTNILDVRAASWIAKDPYADDPPVSSYKSKYPYTLGFVKLSGLRLSEIWHFKRSDLAVVNNAIRRVHQSVSGNNRR